MTLGERARWYFAAPFALALVFAAQTQATAEDTIHVTSHVAYDVSPDQGPVLVSWDISFKNNDPATSGPEDTGTVVFYENVTIPILRGATAISAVSSAGTALDVALEEGTGPTIAARISFDTRVFYGETYDLHLAYQLADVRVPSLLVTPTYVYLPLIAGGDEATVTVNHPTTADWSVSLEPGECTPNGTTFACSGEDAGFLAGLLEVSRPDAVAKLPFEVTLNEQTVNVTLSYFLGERDAAEHLRELTIASLPIIEDHYGFPYPGTNEVAISHGGRQSVLGYEGLTTCRPDSECEVVVSPAADDVTFLHELAHLWSSAYAERWLSEGFAQMLAEEAAAALPEGLLRTRPPEREPVTIDLRLDDWGGVSSLLGAKNSEREVESAGYDRSLRFLYELRAQAGNELLRLANARIAAGEPADSKRFMDVIEEASGQNFDSLFAEWVFPDPLRPALDKRRQARDRLKELTRKTTEAGLPTGPSEEIREWVDAWRFDVALPALDEVERNFAEFEVLMRALQSLTQEAEKAGLAMPPEIAKQTQAGEFNAARLTFADASRALDAYVTAKARIEAPRGIWERFGLLGKDPEQYLGQAADDFAAGDFVGANENAVTARDMIDDAPGVAFRRLVMLAVVFGLIAGGAALGGWFTRRRADEDY